MGHFFVGVEVVCGRAHSRRMDARNAVVILSTIEEEWKVAISVTQAVAPQFISIKVGSRRTERDENGVLFFVYASVVDFTLEHERKMASRAVCVATRGKYGLII